MKILAIGDFHGHFPRKFERLIRKEKIDLIVSNGDYFPFIYRNIWFKHCYGKNIELWQIIGKKKYKHLVLKDLRLGEKVMIKINSLGIPVVSVVGNVDHENKSDVYDLKKPRGDKYWGWDWQDFFSPLIKKYKNINRIDYSFFEFRDFVFIGMNGSSNRGRVKSKAYKKNRKKLEKLFNRFRKENESRKVIFVSHNVPYNTKLDLVGMDAHETVRGEHCGSKLARRIIDKHQPILSIAGHIHESASVQKLGRTFAINTGAAHEGKAAIVEFPEDKNGKVKVKVIK